MKRTVTYSKEAIKADGWTIDQLEALGYRQSGSVMVKQIDCPDVPGAIIEEDRKSRDGLTFDGVTWDNVAEYVNVLRKAGFDAPKVASCIENGVYLELNARSKPGKRTKLSDAKLVDAIRKAYMAAVTDFEAFKALQVAVADGTEAAFLKQWAAENNLGLLQG